MTAPDTLLDNLTQRILLERQIKALFGVDSGTNHSNSSPIAGLTSYSATEQKIVEQPVNRMGVKRKFPSSETSDHDSVSLPSLELEDEISDLEDCNEDTSAATASKSCETRETKRRKVSTDSSDLIVVLDMDECLIHFQMQDENTQVVSNNSSDTTKKQQDENVLYVNQHEILLRPGLVEFLKFVTSRFQTHIFTAGTKDYADSILDRLSKLIGNENAFCKRWYRDDCDTIDILDPVTAFCIDSVYVKPLSKVLEWAGRDSQDLQRIVHIDDQPKNFLLNHSNGIRVAEWKGNKHDSVLGNVTKVLERIDSNHLDVRPYLRTESYLALKDHLDMMHLFPHRRTKGIGATLL
mmetsp:Transcript_4282/g.10206  ORF Transcript_4282/g.10206 Transcript_4282/m.10206 type:complete len:351 (+) Transcript_4282:80-1132(+)